MQFNSKFLTISLFIVLVGLAAWKMVPKTSEAGAAEGESASEADQGDGDKKKSKTEKAFKDLDKKVGGKETPIDVEAAAAVKGDLIQTVSAQGRVHAYQQMDITAEVGGRLLKLHLQDGAVVKKGQVIAEIDDREYRLALTESENALLQSKANYIEYLDPNATEKKVDGDLAGALAQLEKNYKDGLISKDQYEGDKFNLEIKQISSGDRREDVVRAKTMGSAQMAMDRAKLNIEKCVIRAPFNGTVYGLEVTEGQLLNGGTKLARLVNMTDLVVKAQVLESEVGQVNAGRPARVKFTALPDLEDTVGVVKAISPAVNPDNKTVETIIAIQSKDGRIIPGMFAETKIDSQIFKDRLMVPKSAILPRDNRKVVFKVSAENRAKWEYVSTGVENDQFIEITEGSLAPGDMVLTDNHFTMGHDTLVKIHSKTP